MSTKGPKAPPPEKGKVLSSVSVKRSSSTPYGLYYDDDGKFCWRKFLEANPKCEWKAVPVYAFQNAPLKEIWDQVEVVGQKVEYKILENMKTEMSSYEKIYWVGVIQQFFGYMAKVKDEGYPENYDETPSQWINYLTDCFKIGHAADTDGAVIVPPLKMIKLSKDWREVILNRLAGCLTIHSKVSEEFIAHNNLKLQPGNKVEVIDPNRISRMKLGIVTTGAGSRVHVRYWDAIGPDTSPKCGVWCDMQSPSLFPPGWSKTVGHEIDADSAYKPKILSKAFMNDMIDDEGYEDIQVEIGMKLEVIHPENTKYITAATVTKVLKFGYIMVSLDGDCGPKIGTEYCFHLTSKRIFYCGFCKDFGITLIPPNGQSAENFKWGKHLEETGAKMLPIKTFREYDEEHGFSLGSKLEGTDLSYPSAIRLATVWEVKGRLVKIHFDGWSEEYDQWMDYESTEIYPVGWCDANNYKLSGPKIISPFWNTYKHPSQLKSGVDLGQRRGHLLEQLEPPPIIPVISAQKKGIKRRAEDTVENAMFNSNLLKSEAFKLGEKPTIIRRTVEALNQQLPNQELKTNGTSGRKRLSV